MTMNSNQEIIPPLCANGCGFFGQTTTRNLCSKCYRDFLRHQIQSIPEPSVTDNNDSSNSSNEKTNMGRTNNRCVVCKKRVGLLGFVCQCGGYYCGSHRYPEEHCCGVDLKASGRDNLEKELFSGADCKADKLPFRL